MYIPAVNIPRGAIKGDEVTLTLLPAAVAGGIKEYVVFYKPRNVKRVYKFKRTKQPQITLSPLQALTYYTVVVIGYTPNGETYGSQDLHFRTSNGMYRNLIFVFGFDNRVPSTSFNNSPNLRD